MVLQAGKFLNFHFFGENFQPGKNSYRGLKIFNGMNLTQGCRGAGLRGPGSPSGLKPTPLEGKSRNRLNYPLKSENFIFKSKQLLATNPVVAKIGFFEKF